MTNNLLTLEQAIQHTDEKAAALSVPCAEQHKQLAEWLRELQERRKAMTRATELLAGVSIHDNESLIGTIARLQVVISGDYSDE
ncbi:TPA: hypothetical protein R7J70_002187 [Klebsiella pneumoniae]|nr:hypothetical protein [Klebsiella pneumoniae]